MDDSCPHEDLILLEDPQPEDGGQYLLAKAQCGDCNERLSALYEPDESRSDGVYVDTGSNIEIRSNNREVVVKSKVGHEPRTIYYELTALDPIEKDESIFE